VTQFENPDYYTPNDVKNLCAQAGLPFYHEHGELIVCYDNSEARYTDDVHGAHDAATDLLNHLSCEREEISNLSENS